MELTLNLIWAALALAGFAGWLCSERSAQSGVRTQLVALAMLLLILFPVISVSDDFWAAQNPAEADTCMRRNGLTAHAHNIVPEAPMPALAQSFGITFAVTGFRPPIEPLSLRKADAPRSTFFIRPPPAA